MCRSPKKISSDKVRQSQGKRFQRKKGRGLQVNKVEQSQSDEELEYNLFKFKEENKTQPYRENFTVNDVGISMEIDTGASFSVINEKTFRDICRGKENLKLK